MERIRKNGKSLTDNKNSRSSASISQKDDDKKSINLYDSYKRSRHTTEEDVPAPTSISKKSFDTKKRLTAIANSKKQKETTFEN